jgi:hypothetical protein
VFFKASVPSGMCNYDDTLPYENEDKQLWDPTRLSEEVTREYLAKSAETTGAAGIAGVNGIPTGSHIRDDEQVGGKRDVLLVRYWSKTFDLSVSLVWNSSS